MSTEKAAVEHNDLDKQESPRSESIGDKGVNGVIEEENTEQRPWDLRQYIAIASLCILWVGSQLPLYFMGATLLYVTEDLGGKALTQSSWIPVSNTLALAAVCPFTGYMSDLVGRRYITLGGAACICVGIIIVATSHSFGQAITGMAIAGAGAGVGELVALSGVAELVSVKNRGLSVGIIVAFLTPTTPYVIYSQLLSTRTEQGWRWTQWISLIYNGLAFIGILFSYFPESTHHITRPSKAETLKRIDYVGGFLSIVGLALFLVAVQSGGYTHPWTDAYVLAPLIIGILMMISFCFWEWKGAKYPMVPKELFRGQYVVGITFFICFVAGMNFYSLINFFPLSFQTLYPFDPIQIGLKGLGYGISVTFGAITGDILLTVLPKYNKYILLVYATIMVSFIGGLACVTPDNPKTNVALGTIAGFGLGGILVPASTVAMTACPDHLIGTTVALSLSVRLVGGSIGYAIYYNIFSTKLMSQLENVAVAAITAGLPQSEALTFVGALLTDPTAAAALPGVTPQILAAAGRAVEFAYAYGFKYVWLTSIAFGACCIIACIVLPSNAKFLTNRVAARIKH